MRIAYVTQFYPPAVNGVAAVARGLAEGMASRGHAVLVIAPSDRDEPYLSSEGDLKILRLRSRTNEVNGQRVLVFPRSALRDGLRSFRPNVIHTHENMLIGCLALECGRSMAIPVVSTLHQLPWMIHSYLEGYPGLASSLEAVTWICARRLYRQYAAVIAPTSTVAELVCRKTQVHAHTISNGVDLGRFRASPLPACQQARLRARLGLPAGVPVILHVGRLDPEKGVQRVILAAAHAMRTSSAHLLVVGDGAEKPALMELCQSLGIGTRSHFPGFISTRDGLPEVYRLGTLFATASEIETQGLVLLEAAASGLPIIGARATCVPEMVRDALNGYLAEPGDVGGLGRAMVSVLSSPSEAHALGRQSAILAQEHDIRHTMDAHERLYVTAHRAASPKHQPVARNRALAAVLQMKRETARR